MVSILSLVKVLDLLENDKSGSLIATVRRKEVKNFISIIVATAEYSHAFICSNKSGDNNKEATKSQYFSASVSENECIDNLMVKR